MPDLNRYLRHYYDVHQIWTSGAYGKATASMRELAGACRAHEELMFRAPDHRYDRAVPGSYRLIPTPDMRDKLERDYDRMSSMIFGEVSSATLVVQARCLLKRLRHRPCSERANSPLDTKLYFDDTFSLKQCDLRKRSALGHPLKTGLVKWRKHQGFHKPPHADCYAIIVKADERRDAASQLEMPHWFDRSAPRRAAGRG